MKVTMKFTPILSNQIQIWLSRNYEIQIHQNTGIRQDSKPNHVHLWSFWACERQGNIAYFLQQGWARLEEMTESEGSKMETAFTENFSE